MNIIMDFIIYLKKRNTGEGAASHGNFKNLMQDLNSFMYGELRCNRPLYPLMIYVGQASTNPWHVTFSCNSSFKIVTIRGQTARCLLI